MYLQSYGCLEGDLGVWTHLGCAAQFHMTLSSGQVSRHVECRSKDKEYAECTWEGPAHVMEQVGAVPEERVHRHAVRGELMRSDLMNPNYPKHTLQEPSWWSSGAVGTNASGQVARAADHQEQTPTPGPDSNRLETPFFARLFSLPLSYLYDGMDPFTAFEGTVWAGGRFLTMAALRAFKLAILEAGSLHLRVEAARWAAAEWPRLRAFLSQRLPTGCCFSNSSGRWPDVPLRTPEAQAAVASVVPKKDVKGDGAEAQRVVLLISALRAASSNLATSRLGKCAAQAVDREPWPVKLRLDSPCDAERLAAWDDEGLRLMPTKERPVWFERRSAASTDSGMPWRPRFRHDALLAQYLYRIAYRATAAEFRVW